MLMTIIKFVLVLALCIPIIYLSLYFMDRLVNELQDQQVYRERVRRPERKRPTYNFKYEGQVDSKRNRTQMRNTGPQGSGKRERF